ncbi:helix-turn-helix resolvase-like protein [Aquitalea magnusonii]|uniref:Helix-turn-helix resolvase-like protein n=2 Tax=Aquitalea magnusonii TaxID=332411 RepID=A0A318JZ51_9NEIS|nr:helix-turn-helix resolvase-like protein [Aquitalea magnusonii]
MLEYIREGDSLHVYDVSRLGRDAIDVQTVVRALLDKNVVVEIRGIGTISRGAGELVLAVLAQVADMERLRIIERCESGRELAKSRLAETGKTHRGKTSLGRPKVSDEEKAPAIKLRESGMSFSQIAKELGISKATALRYCAGIEAKGFKPGLHGEMAIITRKYRKMGLTVAELFEAIPFEGFSIKMVSNTIGFDLNKIDEHESSVRPETDEIRSQLSRELEEHGNSEAAE